MAAISTSTTPPIIASMLYDMVSCPHPVTMDNYGDPAKRDEVNPFVKLLWERGSLYEREAIADMPNVPSVVELGKTAEDRQVLALFASGAIVGKAFMTSPKVPADRVQALRSAFDLTVVDPEFLAEVAKTNSEFEPISGEKLQKIVEEAASIPAAVRDRARAARGL
jgi:hypothetical protein